jgi:hypothetical protein
MKLALFILLLIFLLLSLFVYTNIQISYKYEVDEAKININIDRSLSIEQKKAKLKEVSELERSINIQSWFCDGVALFSFSGLVIIAISKLRKVRYGDPNIRNL